MNVRCHARLALVAFALLLTLAAPGRPEEFKFTSHVTVPNLAPNVAVKYECWMAMNGELTMTYLGEQWATPNGEVTFVMPGSPTFLASRHCLVELRTTTELGKVTHYRPGDLDWNVEVVTTGGHQDIFLSLRSLPIPVLSPTPR